MLRPGRHRITARAINAKPNNEAEPGSGSGVGPGGGGTGGSGPGGVGPGGVGLGRGGSGGSGTGGGGLGGVMGGSGSNRIVVAATAGDEAPTVLTAAKFAG